MNNLIANQRFHFGVYGILINDRRILMVKKSRGPYKGMYDLPGGGVEFNEKIEDALRREFKEEVNIVLDNYKFFNYNEYFSEYSNEKNEPRKVHHVGLYYLVTATFKSIKKDSDGQDSLGAEFIDINKFDIESISPIARPVIKSVISANMAKCNIGEYGIVLNRQGKFLILQLPINEEFTRKLWMFPGGRLESGEQPELGLKREVYEETGLKVKIVMPVHTARWGIENPAKYSVFYICRITGKEDVKISKEHVAYKWVDFKEIEKIYWHNINSKIAAKKTREMLAHGF